MMDGEDVYRTRLEACLAAVQAATLPQVRERHLTAARTWRTLLESVLERKAAGAALSDQKAAQEATMDDMDYQMPDAVYEAIFENGTPAVRAFRESSGMSQHDVAVGSGLTDERMAEIERGRGATNDELARIGAVMGVPADMLVDE